MDFDIDLKKLVLPQNFQDLVGTKKVWTHIPVRKPSKTEFFRILDDEKYTIQAGIVEDKNTRENYLIGNPELFLDLGTLLTPVQLVVAITTLKTLMIWPVKLPGDRRNQWHDTALAAMELAKNSWICIRPDMAAGCYQILEASEKITEPEFPNKELTFKKMLELAFKDTLIMDADHPMMKLWSGRSL